MANTFIRCLEVGEALGGLAEGGLGGNAGEGKHGKTAVLELTELHAADLVLGLSLEEAEGVEAVVSGLAVALALGNLNEDGAGAELEDGGDGEEEAHGSLGDKDVVGGVRAGDGLDGVHLSGEAEGEAEGTVGGQPAEPGHHGDAAVLELGLAHPVEGGDVGLLLPLRGLDEAREVLGDGGEVEGVEANVADHGAVKVGRAGEEGDGLGSLRLVDHGVPEAVGHGAEGRGGLVGALGGEGGGRGGAEGSNGELHFSTLLLYRRRESGAYHWHEGARRVEVAPCVFGAENFAIFRFKHFNLNMTHSTHENSMSAHF